MKRSNSTSAEVHGGAALGLRSRHQARTAAGFAAVLAVVVAGCGGDDSGAAGTSAAGTGSAAGVGSAAGTGSGTGAVAGTGSAAGKAGSAAGTGAAAGTGGAAGGTFTQVLTIFGPDGKNCGICHASPAGTINGGLHFNSTDKAGTLAAFVGKMSAGTTGSKCGGKTYVVAGDPAGSLLYQKLSSATPPCGTRMPQGGNPLSEAELQKVSAWIMAGAKND